MATFTWVPDQSSDINKTPRVKKVQFGDGYMQRAPDGINHIARKYSLKFASSATDLQAIDTFLTARGGTENFDWTPPDYPAVAGKFICEQWGWDYQNNRYNITATFEEVFES